MYKMYNIIDFFVRNLIAAIGCYCIGAVLRAVPNVTLRFRTFRDEPVLSIFVT